MDAPFQRILVGLSLTALDKGLIQYASMIAGWGKVKVIDFLHVLPESSAALRESSLPLVSHGEAVQQVQNQVQDAFGPVPEGCRLSFQVSRGTRIDSLLEFSANHETDLILVGHRKSRSGRRSLAKRLAMKAPCSVWMVPEDSPVRIRRILAPVDFSRFSADALQVATALGSLANIVECLALHVYFNEATITYDEYDEVLRGKEVATFSKFIAPINLHGVELNSLFLEGFNVAKTIVTTCQEKSADLIVMGTRGRSRSAAILLGSETEHTITETSVPILAVKHFGSRMNLLQALLDKKFRARTEDHFGSLL
ncbi:MAG: universal stress protein [Acidobacteriota bacterium]